jgi:hypothetical protein
LRGFVSYEDYFYAGPDCQLPGVKRPFYYVVRDHYSQVLTPFEAIERPAAFMALMRLDDNFRILSPEGYNLPTHIIRAKGVIKNHKLAMLQFITHLDEFIFDNPSGPEGLVPAAHCLITNNMFLFHRIRRPRDFYDMRSADGKSLINYCSNKQMEVFKREERIKMYTQVDGALNTFLIKNLTTKKERMRFYDEEVVEALETLYQNGKQDQLREYAGMTGDRTLLTFMAQIGYAVDNFASNVSKSDEKECVKADSRATFDFMNLPAEILEFIMAGLSARDILSLFVVNKSTLAWYKAFNSNTLWRQILANSKLSLDGDIPVPSENFKKYVLNTERYKKNWRQGKYAPKTLCNVSNFVENALLDDNWLIAVSCTSSMHATNMHNNQQWELQLTDGAYYLNANHCIVESPPFDPPLVALYSSQSKLYYGRYGGSSTGFLQLPTVQYDRCIVYAQSNDRVVTSAELRVVDLNAQCIVSQLVGMRVGLGVANPFDRSMSVGSAATSMFILDRDMRIVQTLKRARGIKVVSMVDEFNIACIDGNKLVLYDTRKMEPENCHVLVDDTPGENYAVDVRNQRMLVTAGPYNMVAQIDLKTRKWERVWKRFTDYYRTYAFPLINDKYLVLRKNSACSQIEAYDFSV